MLPLLMIITLITIIYKMLLYSPSTRFVRTDFKDTVRHCSCDCDVGVVLNMERIFIINHNYFSSSKKGQSQPNALGHNCRSNPWDIWTRHRERQHSPEGERTNQTETRRLTPPSTPSRGKVLSGNDQSNDRPYVSGRAYFLYVR